MLVVFHHHRLAADMAVVPAVSRSGFIMAVFNMNNFILSLTQTNVNMHIGSLGLSTQYEAGYTGQHSEFCEVFFHGLCFVFCAALHALYINTAQ